MSAHHRTSREDGLSLVEMMVALLIVGLVLAALASSLVTALRAVRGQESTTQATAAINDILEESQRIDYDEAVLCTATADSVFPPPSGTFESEPLVVSSSVCGPDELPVERTVVRDGRTYTVTTAITWADDPSDNDPATGTDADGTQDIKRVTVDVEWATDGRVRTARNMAFRAPQFLEQLVTAEVAPDDDGKFITISDGAVDGVNDEPFTLRVFAREKLTSVEATWIDRTGAPEEGTMTAVSGSEGLVWEYPLHANFGPFANGGTLFTFDALAASGETEEVAARGLFLYDPMEVVGGGLGGGSSIRVDGTTGLACLDQVLSLDVKGAIRSDVATASWKRGSMEPTSASMASADAPTELALSGARFALDVGGQPGFVVQDDTGTYQPPSGGIQIRRWVERIVDSTPIDEVVDNYPVEVVDAC